jgi:hypothetical protein
VKDFAQVAKLLCGGDPPRDLIDELAKAAEIIGGPNYSPTRQDLRDEKRDDQALLVLLKTLQSALHPYLQMYEDYEWLELPSAVDHLSQDIDEVLDLIKDELFLPYHHDGRIDYNRRICLTVCDYYWAKYHGQSNLYANDFIAACDALWWASHPKEKDKAAYDWKKLVEKG